MNIILKHTQKRILIPSIFITLIVTFMSCSGTSQKNNPNKFIGTWIEIRTNSIDTWKNNIKIEKFGNNFSIKPSVPYYVDNNINHGVDLFTASYNKELDKLVVPSALYPGTDIIYNSESKTILAWGSEFKKAEDNK
jgi:hypothetical protein